VIQRRCLKAAAGGKFAGRDDDDGELDGQTAEHGFSRTLGQSAAPAQKGEGYGCQLAQMPNNGSIFLTDPENVMTPKMPTNPAPPAVRAPAGPSILRATPSTSLIPKTKFGGVAPEAESLSVQFQLGILSCTATIACPLKNIRLAISGDCIKPSFKSR